MSDCPEIEVNPTMVEVLKTLQALCERIQQLERRNLEIGKMLEITHSGPTDYVEVVRGLDPAMISEADMALSDCLHYAELPY